MENVLSRALYAPRGTQLRTQMSILRQLMRECEETGWLLEANAININNRNLLILLMETTNLLRMFRDANVILNEDGEEEQLTDYPTPPMDP